MKLMDCMSTIVLLIYLVAHGSTSVLQNTDNSTLQNNSKPTVSVTTDFKKVLNISQDADSTSNIQYDNTPSYQTRQNGIMNGTIPAIDVKHVNPAAPSDIDLATSQHLRKRSASDPDRLYLEIDVSKVLHITTPYYISLTIDSNIIRKKMKGLDLSSKKLIRMSAALSPTNIRLGGTYANFLHFDPNGTESVANLTNIFRIKNKKNFIMTGAYWDSLTAYIEQAGWDIMWDFNLFYWKNGLWDSTNAIEFLKYSQARGIKIPSFQLGNEPNSFKYNFNFTIAPDILVKDIQILRDVLTEFPLYSASAIYGPENTNMYKRGSSRGYLTEFLKSGGCDVVAEISTHHYYLNGKTATASDFIDPVVMDSLLMEFEIGRNITSTFCRARKLLRLTETSSCYGGGAPGLSDRFVAGFLWLDKLGLAAKNGITHVFRQSFYGGNYGLIKEGANTLPDYWLTLLYKRLIEGPVFNVSKDQDEPLVRVYAHCARKDYYKYPDGAVVLYYLNLGSTEQVLTLPYCQMDEPLHLFVLTAGDSFGLRSSRVKLNGETIFMNGSNLPDLLPKVQNGDVQAPPQSFGFIVIPNANAAACKIYHGNHSP